MVDETITVNWQILLPSILFLLSEVLGVLHSVKSNGVIDAAVIGIQSALAKINNKNDLLPTTALPT